MAPFILSIIAWPVVTFLSISLLSKILMPIFTAKADYDVRRADFFQIITLIASQIIVVFVAQWIYGFFNLKATTWLAIPFGLWCFAFGPMSWQIYDYLKWKYEGIPSSDMGRHLGKSWTIGLGIGWVIGTILLFY